MGKFQRSDLWSVEETTKLVEFLRKEHLNSEQKRSRIKLVHENQKNLEELLPKRDLRQIYNRLAYLAMHGYMSKDYKLVKKQQKNADPNRVQKPVKSSSKPSYLAFPGIEQKLTSQPKQVSELTKVTTFVREQQITLTVPSGTVMETYSDGSVNIISKP